MPLHPEVVRALRLIARLSHLSYEVLYDRLINLRWDMVVAQSVPVDKDVSLLFCGLNGKAYYSVPFSNDPVTARQIVAHYNPARVATYDKLEPTGRYHPFDMD